MRKLALPGVQTTREPKRFYPGRSLAAHLVGFVGMVWMFRTWNMKQVGHYGSALAVGVALFAYNIGRTLLRSLAAEGVACDVLSVTSWSELARDEDLARYIL